MYALLFLRKEEGGVLLLCLLFLNCLPLKITLLPKGHVLRWRVLMPFRSASCGLASNILPSFYVGSEDYFHIQTTLPHLYSPFRITTRVPALNASIYHSVHKASTLLTSGDCAAEFHITGL